MGIVVNRVHGNRRCFEDSLRNFEIAFRRIARRGGKFQKVDLTPFFLHEHRISECTANINSKPASFYGRHFRLNLFEKLP